MKNFLRQFRRKLSRVWDNFMEQRGYVRKQPLPDGEGWLALKGRRITLELMVRPDQIEDSKNLPIKLGQLLLDNQYIVSSQYRFAVDHVITMVQRIPEPLTNVLKTDKLSKEREA